MSELVFQNETHAKAVASALEMKIKSFSFVATLLLIGVCCAVGYFFTPLMSISILMILVILIPTPLGTFVSIFTFWSGKWINSCPHCFSVSLNNFQAEVVQCNKCKKHAVTVAPVTGAKLIKNYSDGEITHYCWSCR